MEFFMGFLLGAGIASLFILGAWRAWAAHVADAVGAL